MNHTPGPWEVSLSDVCIRRIHKRKSRGVYLDIADVYPINGKANARLIAAAPELLTLLKRSRYYLKPGYSIPCTDLINEIDEKLTTIEKGS